MSELPGSVDTADAPAKKARARMKGVDGDPEGNQSFVGSKWVDYWQDQGKDAYDPANLPKVEVTFKFYSITNLEVKEGTFQADFMVMLDWEDPSLGGAHAKDGSTPDFAQHFFPYFDIDNSVEEPEYVDGRQNPRLRPRPNHLTVTQRIRCTMRTKYDVADFPFDLQYLDVVVKFRSISNGVKWSDGEKNTYVETRDPIDFRVEDGHQIVAGGDWLDEFDIVDMFGAPQSAHRGSSDLYIMQIRVRRDSQNIVWNLVCAILVVVLLAFANIGVDMPDLADRLAAAFTLVLTLMAFKYVLADQLPKVPILTLLDKYNIGSLLLIIVQCIHMTACKLMLDHELFPEETVNQIDNGGWILSGVILIGLNVMLFIAYKKVMNPPKYKRIVKVGAEAWSSMKESKQVQKVYGDVLKKGKKQP